MEFHISRSVREQLDLDDLLFSFTGNVIFANVAASRKLSERLNTLQVPGSAAERAPGAGELFAMGLIDELSHALIARYRQQIDPGVLADALAFLSAEIGPQALNLLLLEFTGLFPNVSVFRQELTAEQWLKGKTEDHPHREAALEELLLLWLANSNPAFAPFKLLFGDASLREQTAYADATTILPEYFETRPPVDPVLGTLLEALRAPMLASPDSLTGQLDFIRVHWAPVLGQDLSRVLLAVDVLREEEIAVWLRFHPAGPVRDRHGEPGRNGEGFVGDEYVGFDDDFITLPDGTRRRRYDKDYQAPLNEFEAFSADQDWMPTVVLIAKNTYVWLEQLSKKYGRHIHRLDQVPDEELQILARRGINALWLIGLWERSAASRIIKHLRGNTDAVASAYSLKDYRIAEDLGGEEAYRYLKEHAARAGLRLASDMVPNHMGIDSEWVIKHPDWFISRWESPFPVYTFEGPDVSTDSRVEIKIEDHYYDRSDAAVVFRLRHHADGNTRYMYHGNDGTTFAWNDTAQLDYSKAYVRESVMQVILDVARRFPIIRFDAAMVLAKRHVQRLWFPVPGAGGSIPSRSEDAMSDEAFNELMPNEFWREVVDRVAVEVPGTLLLAEAFWLLEGYFVRTLGMHRVYNSAFMNMLRDEENAKYRSYLKKTVEFDPDILKRYVNFMSNPDERTALDQFGSGDKYFGVSVLLATLPGLPMFGHGQIEGFTERYGMDFQQARLDEYPNEDLINRHQHLIAPLLKQRHLFAESTHFLLYDFCNEHGTVEENVFAYSNRHGGERAVILYNNSYQSSHGTIHSSVGFLDKATGSLTQRSLAHGLNLPNDGGTVIAYTDTVTGLEYLRRSTVLHDHGLSVGLRGYQHVALLNWRELRSTAAQPWDQLCDALHGAGVYSVEEALSKLRVRPLLEALRAAVSPANIDLFTRLSRESAATILTAKATPKKQNLPAATAPAEPAPAQTREQQLNPQLDVFRQQANLFQQRVAELPEVEHNRLADSSPTETTLSALTAASLRLPVAMAALPEVLQRAARLVSPSSDIRVPSSQTWAPVLAWLVFQTLPPQFDPLVIFEKLNLRWALAETFSSVGLKGEDAWKAAARIRVLLRFGSSNEALHAARTPDFWCDPDVLWLAGVNRASGTEYIQRERFEELLVWLELPALCQTLTSTITPVGFVNQGKSTATYLLQSLERVNFELQPFLRLTQGNLGQTPQPTETAVPPKLKASKKSPKKAAGKSDKQ